VNSEWDFEGMIFVPDYYTLSTTVLFETDGVENN